MSNPVACALMQNIHFYAFHTYTRSFIHHSRFVLFFYFWLVCVRLRVLCTYVKMILCWYRIFPINNSKHYDARKKNKRK